MAPDAIANLLLRIRGDVRDGEQKVSRFTRRLRELDKEEAEPEVNVQTKEAVSELESFRRNLSRLSRAVADPKVELDTGEARANVLLLLAELNKIDTENVDPKIEANISRAMAELGVLQAMIDKVDSDDIVVDVKVRRDLVSRMNQVVGAVGNVTKAFDKAEGPTRQFASAAEEGGKQAFKLTSNIGPFGLSGAAAKAAAALLGVAVLAGGALVGGLAAMAASAALAVAALGALAVAGGAVFAGLVGVIGLVAWRISDLIKKGGQLGKEFQRAGQQTADVFQRTVSPALRAPIRAITAELRNFRPLIEQLRKPFMDLTSGFTAGFKAFADSVRSNWGQIKTLISGVGDAFKPLGEGAGALLDIFLQIANLALPFLISGLTTMANKFKEWADALRENPQVMDTIMSHLSSWLDLAYQLGRVFLGFLRAAGPAGQELVNWLAEGAKKLADWLNSEDGQKRMKQFFEEIVPVVKEAVEFIGRLVVAFFELVEAAAPTLSIIIGLLNSLLSAITFVLDEFNKLPDAAKVALTALLILGRGGGLIGGLGVLVRLLAFAFFLVGPAASAAGGAIAAFTAAAAVRLATLIGAAASVGGAIVSSLAAGLLARASFLALALRTTIAAAMASAATGLGAAMSFGGALISSIVAGMISRIAFLATALRAGFPGMLAVAGRATLIGAAIMGAIQQGMFILGGTGLVDTLERIIQVALLGGVFPFQVATLFGKNLVGEIVKGIGAAGGLLKTAVSKLFGGSSFDGIISSSFAKWRGTANRGVSDVAKEIANGASRFKDGINRGMSGATKSIEEGASRWAGAVRKGISSASAQAAAGGRKIAADAARGVRQGEPQAHTSGAALGRAVGTGIGSASGAVQGAASRLGQSALTPLEGAANSAQSSGARLGQMFASGITSALGAVQAGAAKIAAAASSQLPHSEPKDHSSPLYGLEKSGVALVQLFAAGIRRGVPMGVLAMDLFTSELSARLQGLGEASTRAGKAVVASLERILRMADRVKQFQEVVASLGDQFDDVTDKALTMWADAREQMALAAIDASPLGQELAGLLAADQQADFGGSMQTAQDRIDDAKKALEDLNAELNDPGRSRSKADIESDIVNQQRALRDATAEQAKLARQDRIREIQVVLDAQKNAAAETAQLERDGRTQAAQAFRDSMTDQLTALQNMLAAGEISYKQFVKRVRKILGPLGLELDISGADSQVLAAGKSFMDAFISGLKHAGSRAKKVLRDILADLRALLPGSEPKDKNSPLRKLANAGNAVMDNFTDGLQRSGKLALRAMNAEIAPMAQVANNIAVSPSTAAPAQQAPTVHIGQLNRTYNLPPGPGGGYEPMYAAAQLDELMQNEGRI